MADERPMTRRAGQQTAPDTKTGVRSGNRSAAGPPPGGPPAASPPAASPPAGDQPTGDQPAGDPTPEGPLSNGRRDALLVDWGGVLTTNLFVSFNEYCVREGVDFEALGQRFLGDSEFRALLIALETGRLTEREFEPRLAALLGVAPEGLIDGLLAGVHPDEAMIEAVRSARGAGVRTALVSNSWGVHRYPRALFAEIFDGLVISGEVGVRKPAPQMYELGAQRAGVPPERCVYVDDLPHNLEPARALGMATVHHTTSESTIPQLERLLGVRLASAAARPVV